MSTLRTSLRRIHQNQDGTISLVAVFAVMLLTMLLGMVMNLGRQVADKIRMQNAADAAAYSGGVVLARGLNTLAFTNHLLCDVFATTAFLREARQRNAESYTPSILAAWRREGPVFASSGLPKFQNLGSAITQKVPLEQELVRSYSDWAAAASEQILPLLEDILAQEMVPRYQRAVVATFPDIAQAAVMEVARRHDQPDFGRGRMWGAFWRSSGQMVGDAETSDPTLPVIDPQQNATPEQPHYASIARGQREDVASHYLRQWNDKAMVVFDREAKMSQFSALWRSFTCGHLHHLLNEEHFDTNLPMLIRPDSSGAGDGSAYLEQDFTFLGVVYWRRLPELLPGVFESPLEHDGVTYAQVRVFVPRARLEWWRESPGREEIGGVPGEFPDLPGESSDAGEGCWIVRRQPAPEHWDLWNQHWTCQLTPTTLPALATILRTPPPLPGFAEAGIKLPDLGGLSTEEIGRISPH